MQPNRAGLYPSTIGVCICTYQKWFDITIESIKNIQGNVDEIHIISDDFDDAQINEIIKLGATYHYVVFEDSPPKYRNTAAKFCNTGWILHLDSDELPTKEMCENLRNVVKQSYIGTKYQVVRFMSQIVFEGKEYEPCADKLILHTNIDDVYVGLHHPNFKDESFKQGVTVPYTYKHFKTTEDLLFNATRDVYICGGGTNAENLSGLWKPLREWTTNNNINKWIEMKNYLINGNIDFWLKNWIEKAYNIFWHNYEYKSFALLYYNKLHPEEDIDKKYQLPIKTEVIRKDGHVRVDIIT